jgi:Skp family chaperone for outer membrane proteins
MEISNNYSNYATNYTNETKENDTKKYTNVRDYKNYLTDKYDCMKSKDYSVAINSSLLSEALGDEKTAKWLEYNLSLIPETVEKTKAMVQARGSQIISYNITINGYDSMTAELCTKAEADTGVEKNRKELEEKIKKMREEKKEKEEKLEDKAKADDKINKEQSSEDAKLPDTYTMIITGTSVDDTTQKFMEKLMWDNEYEINKSGMVGFDVKA